MYVCISLSGLPVSVCAILLCMLCSRLHMCTSYNVCLCTCIVVRLCLCVYACAPVSLYPYGCTTRASLSVRLLYYARFSVCFCVYACVPESLYACACVCYIRAFLLRALLCRYIYIWACLCVCLSNDACIPVRVVCVRGYVSLYPCPCVCVCVCACVCDCTGLRLYHYMYRYIHTAVLRELLCLYISIGGACLCVCAWIMMRVRPFVCLCVHMFPYIRAPLYPCARVYLRWLSVYVYALGVCVCAPVLSVRPCISALVTVCVYGCVYACACCVCVCAHVVSVCVTSVGLYYPRVSVCTSILGRACVCAYLMMHVCPCVVLG
jgi:hypothetical protein